MNLTRLNKQEIIMEAVLEKASKMGWAIEIVQPFTGRQAALPPQKEQAQATNWHLVEEPEGEYGSTLLLVMNGKRFVPAAFESLSVSHFTVEGIGQWGLTITLEPLLT